MEDDTKPSLIGSAGYVPSVETYDCSHALYWLDTVADSCRRNARFGDARKIALEANRLHRLFIDLGFLHEDSLRDHQL
jgi:hypothetical protein